MTDRKDKYMKIVGIESSGMVASVALWSEQKIVAEYTTDFKQTHSQTLLPMLDEMMGRVGIDISEVDAIAVSGGPGSFTGLRIGSATAKGLGLALNKPLINVPTLDAMAYQVCGFPGLVCPMMDARRNQVFTGIYHTGLRAEAFTVLAPAYAEDINVALDRITEQRSALDALPVAFLGDGALLQKDKILERIPDAVFMPEFMDKQRAAVVASLGAVYYARGITETAEEHKPEYLRVSQAEREREERLQQEQ